MRRLWTRFEPHIMQSVNPERLSEAVDLGRDEDVVDFAIGLRADDAFRVDRRAGFGPVLDDIQFLCSSPALDRGPTLKHFVNMIGRQYRLRDL